MKTIKWKSILTLHDSSRPIRSANDTFSPLSVSLCRVEMVLSSYTQWPFNLTISRCYFFSRLNNSLCFSTISGAGKEGTYDEQISNYNFRQINRGHTIMD